MYIKATGSYDVHGRPLVDMFGKIILTLSALAFASAQIPSLGFCPDYVPMANFDMNRFLGVWYEAERYFQLTEVVSRCVMANYTRAADGKYRVSNEVTNRFTGIKRILEGEIKKPASKAEEGKLLVKYTIPLSPETKYSVLETDYDSYAVLWSCSGIGPVHTQNAWLMTRQRLAPGAVLQKAYGVLDKYKISKSFFVKTDQDDCAYLDSAPTAETEEKPADAEQPVEPQQDAARFAVALEEEADDQTKKSVAEPIVEPVVKPVVLEEVKPVEDVAENTKSIETVPEHILKTADSMKEEKLVEVPKEEKMSEKKEEKSDAAEEKLEKMNEKSA